MLKTVRKIICITLVTYLIAYYGPCKTDDQNELQKQRSFTESNEEQELRKTSLPSLSKSKAIMIHSPGLIKELKGKFVNANKEPKIVLSDQQKRSSVEENSIQTHHQPSTLPTGAKLNAKTALSSNKETSAVVQKQLVKQ